MSSQPRFNNKNQNQTPGPGSYNELINLTYKTRNIKKIDSGS